MYAGDMQWTNWTAALYTNATASLTAITQGKLLADKWNQMTYGLTPAQILALPQFANSGKTAADIENMQYAMGVFTDLYNAMFNVAALTQFNREGYLDPFI
jgi:hypothetical protein